MWLLENDEIFKGRRLWLRPGNTYLFGRTAAEPGQLAVSHNTISRKHLTITVDNVEEGQSEHLSSRSGLTIEDLATKIGTEVNGLKIKGGKYVVTDSEVEVIMGKCPSKFCIKWFPVVLTFSFTNKELQTQPLTSLRERFERLDIKLATDYSLDFTTHVVAKKRNTAKGLQALINGKYVVAETFLDAIAQAAEPPQGDDVTQSSGLERDFSHYWPDAMQHLPPRGGEPVQHPDSIYAPDLGRRDVFDGYTFIVYDKTQYNNLLPPITNGLGKAMLRTITPGEESIESFVRYVKEVAGEKGLGCFDDGSEGKGVVLVRYLPGKGDLIGWYTDFITAVSLRLDHRPIEQNEFLEAILTKDASKLRRPLEVENSPPSSSVTRPAADQAGRASSGPVDGAVDGPVDGPGSYDSRERLAQPQPSDEPDPGPALRRVTRRRPAKKRFAGFDDDVDMDADEPSPAIVVEPAPPPEQEDEGGLFVSQEPDISQTLQAVDSGHAARKRRAPPLAEDDLMDGMAPAAARLKRQRLEYGRSFASPSPEPAAHEQPTGARSQSKKQRGEMDVLAMAARHREEEEARARAEREDLAQLPDDVDLAEIRRLHIVEEMDVRRPGNLARTRERDIADGRWDPRWNGVKNFKKFRRRGEAGARQPARVIVPLTQVKNKEFGVGDNYWLEEGSGGGARSRREPAHSPDQETHTVAPSPPPPPPRRTRIADSAAASDASNDEAGSGGPASAAPPSTRATPSQASRQTGASQARSGRKRPAPEEPAAAAGRGSKRRMPAAAAAPRGAEGAAGGGDDSDDELRFRFGRRR